MTEREMRLKMRRRRALRKRAAALLALFAILAALIALTAFIAASTGEDTAYKAAETESVETERLAAASGSGSSQTAAVQTIQAAAAEEDTITKALATAQAVDTGTTEAAATPTALVMEETVEATVRISDPEPEAASRCAGITITDNDVELLARLAYHEARGESLEGQIAVVEVVLNRCLSEEFPDTVEEVIFQQTGGVWQFTPAPYLYDAEPEAAQYEAVYAAIAAEDPILPTNAVFFSASPYNDNIVAVIGNHYFCSIS